jgi:hypothetical protein
MTKYLRNVNCAGNITFPTGAGIGSTKKQIYDTPGTYMWEPSNRVDLANITVKVWGAGGGGGRIRGRTDQGGGGGGSGGFVRQTLSLSPGETLAVIVGRGGEGGNGGGGEDGMKNATGGTASHVFVSSGATYTLRVCAGGGGGGGTDNVVGPSGAGGGGGGANQNGEATIGGLVFGGTAGNDGIGGVAAAIPGGVVAVAGEDIASGITTTGISSLDEGVIGGRGGDNPTSDVYGLPGGGGGGYGGGSSGNYNSTIYQTGGGGGGGGNYPLPDGADSLVGNSSLVGDTGDTGDGSSGANKPGGLAPNALDEDYNGTAGNGGNSGTATITNGSNGSDGLIVIMYNEDEMSMAAPVDITQSLQVSGGNLASTLADGDLNISGDCVLRSHLLLGDVTTNPQNGVSSSLILFHANELLKYLTPAGVAHVIDDSSRPRTEETAETSVTLQSEQYVVRFTATSGPIACTLPAISSVGTKTYHLINESASQTVTVTPDPADTIDGNSSLTLSTPFSSIVLRAVGGNRWYTL